MSDKMWKILFTKQAQKDAKIIAKSNLRTKVEAILRILEEDPFTKMPPYEKLIGDLDGAYSRRINIQDRLVYQVFVVENIIKVNRMWIHYE